MMPFRSIIYTAINNGWLQRDPFYAYRITKEETKRGFLTKEEITMLINGTFKKKSYELIRDLFIFCCFSGLGLSGRNSIISQPTIYKHHSMGIYGLRPIDKRRERKPISDCSTLPNISSRSIKVWRKAINCCLYPVMPLRKQQECLLASKQTQLCNNHLLIQWSTH